MGKLKVWDALSSCLVNGVSLRCNEYKLMTFATVSGGTSFFVHTKGPSDHSLKCVYRPFGRCPFLTQSRTFGIKSIWQKV